MATKIERERKWLIKRTPEEAWNNCNKYYIEQFYTPDGWRYRYTQDMQDDTEKYEKLMKVSVGRGVNHEIDVEEITESEYDRVYKDNKDAKHISKYRLTYGYGGRLFEIDDFDNLTLCIVEVEHVDMEDTVIFPKWLEDEILMEVTGMPQFSNANLAIKDDEDEL